MVGITGITSVIERLDETTNDADVGLRLAQEQPPAVAAQGAAVEISLETFPGTGSVSCNLAFVRHVYAAF
jgi:hypothetical protein